MRKLWLLFALLCALPAAAQQPLPNISYGANLNSSCATANTSCANAVFVTGNTAINQIVTSPGQTASALDIPVTNYAAATITVSGTYSGLTVNFDFSDPTGGVNYFQEVCARTDANILETSEVVPTNQVRAWNCPVWGNTRFRVRASAFSTGSVQVWITITTAAIDPSLVVAAAPPVIPGSTDSCQDLSQIKSSAFANITTATTTSLVAPSGTTNILLCGYEITSFSTTTANTVILENGTGASCATSPVALSPTMTNSTSAQPVIWRRDGGHTVLSTGASQGLCALTTVGSTPNITIWITYVQQ